MHLSTRPACHLEHQQAFRQVHLAVLAGSGGDLQCTSSSVVVSLVLLESRCPPFIDVMCSLLRATLTVYALKRLRTRGIKGRPSSVAVESPPSVSLSSVAEPASEGVTVKSSSAMLSPAKSNSSCGAFLCSISVSHHASSIGNSSEPPSLWKGASLASLGLQRQLDRSKPAGHAPLQQL